MTSIASLSAHPALACALLTAVERLHDVRLVRHLKNLHDSPWYVAALVSWGIALFEYLLQVPANRIGYTALSLGAAQDHAGGDHAGRVRAVRRALHGQPLKLDYLWAAPVHLGAVYFIVSKLSFAAARAAIE